MDRFEVDQLKPGEKLRVKTESGSTYDLEAEKAPEAGDEHKRFFRGLRVTRDRHHAISGRDEGIEDAPAILFLRSTGAEGVLQTGDTMELDWDRDHPENKDWDYNAGVLFSRLTTSRIAGIEVVPVEEN